jgi:hypothetical protein
VAVVVGCHVSPDVLLSLDVPPWYYWLSVASTRRCRRRRSKLSRSSPVNLTRASGQTAAAQDEFTYCVFLLRLLRPCAIERQCQASIPTRSIVP